MDNMTTKSLTSVHGKRPPPLTVRAVSDDSASLELLPSSRSRAAAMATTGVSNVDVATELVARVGTVLGVKYANPQMTQAEANANNQNRFNGAGTKMRGLEPADAMEGMTAALLVAVQDAALHELAEATSGAKEYDNRARCAGSADRLISAFVRLADLRTRLRGGGTMQRVTVEHVTVAAGGQAVIGLIASPGGTGGRSMTSDDQPRDQA